MIQRHHGWFVAFAPAEAPEITVAVIAEHACAGSAGGGPVAHDIILAYMQKYHPERIKAKAELRESALKRPIHEELPEE